MSPSSSLDLTNKTAVIVGGTSGIGLTLAKGLAQAGANVVPTGRRADLVEAAAKAVRDTGRRALAHPADVNDRKSLQSLLDATLAEFGGWVQERLFFLDYAPVIFTSAHSGFNLERLLDAVRYVAAQLQQRVPTAILNRTLQDAIERRQPVSAHGHRLKFFYATQVKQAPPTFLLFVNREELLSDPHKKYLADQMRRAFGYEGCPVILVPKARPKTIEPRRDRKKKRAA